MRDLKSTLVSAMSATAIFATLGALAQPAPPAGGPPPGGPPPGMPMFQTGRDLGLSDVHVRAEPKSKARGAEFPPVPDTIVGADPRGLSGGGGRPIKDGRAIVAAENGAVPKGITPLPRDVFSSDDFYVDRNLWMDQRYWRCNSPVAVSAAQGAFEAPTIGDDFPRTVSWGFCDRDYDVKNIVSPYPYKTAQEHYEALMAEAGSRGGPTKYTHDKPPPDYNGNYSAGSNGLGGFRQNQRTRSWMSTAINQVPTYLSLLTPEYQQRMVQQLYHDAHNQSQWPGPYCWPDGFLYQWFANGAGNLLVTPDLVQINSGLNEPIVTQVFIDRKFNMDGAVPNLTGVQRQITGDSIGFWDGDMLVVWTSNIKHWMAHGIFENSDQMQAIRIFTPIDDKDGKFVGLVQESVFYDPEALVKPVRVVYRWQRSATFAELNPGTWQKCLPQFFPIDGRQTTVSPGTTIQYDVPDMSGRPWADIWVKYFEKDMQRPKEKDVLSGF